jgi:hypothetical protein
MEKNVNYRRKDAMKANEFKTKEIHSAFDEAADRPEANDKMLRSCARTGDGALYGNRRGGKAMILTLRN